jgi:diguanylate cyclase (GGDEF)-like protein/PAS domain S-box-containing protein
VNPSSRRADARDHSRFLSLLLLLPMVVVAAASVGGLVVNSAASTSLQRTEAIDVQVVGIRADVSEVAVSGTAFLVTHLAKDAAAFTAVGEEVDDELANMKASPGLNPGEAAAAASAVRAWGVTSTSRKAVLVVGAVGASAVQVVLRPVFEEQMNESLTEFTSQLTTLDDLISADLAAKQQARNIAQTASATAVAAGILVGFVAALWLLRQLKERQEAVRRRERRLSALVERATDGILVMETGGQVTFATPAFDEEYFGGRAGVTFDGLLHSDDLDRATKAWERVATGSGGTASEVEARLLRRDGEWRHVWVRLTNRADDPAVGGIVVNVTDVTDRHEFEKKLTHQSLHDALTGLPNRDFLRHRMERAAATAGDDEHSVLFLDCDDFKRVNDTFGHAAGDRYLVEVSGRVVASVRPEDTVARLGGDEFAILLESTGVEGAAIAAQRIVGALCPPIIIEGKAVHPSASIGLASGKLDAVHPETLLADADLAMYFAKRAGKGGYRVFADEMRTQLVDRLELGEDLRQAVESAALEVEYQPIVDLSTGRIVGAEALARWHHASRGWVGPNIFIPLAEELGLVERIDQGVLREACTVGRSWIDDGLHDFRMAVNLSGSDLDQPDLVAQIARVLHETTFPAGLLEIELTEGVAINKSGGGQDILDALKSLGVHLSIDDFGTGYSALSRLRSLPFDRLKVDKAFVDDIDRVHRGAMLVDTIIDMAHVLRLDVVAEGVETTSQLDYLRERGCQFAQGYLFGRPMAPAALTTLLKRQRLAVLAPVGHLAS